MEYYILKLYQREKAKDSDVEQGFNRFQPKTKKIVLICLIVMFLSCAEMIATVVIVPQTVWYIVGFVVCIVVFFMLVGIDNKDQKTRIDKYVDSQKKKIDILYNLLSDKFHINNKEKVEELINIYQIYVDKKNNDEKSRGKIVLTLFTALGGILSISFSNMDIIGIDFSSWLYFAIVLIIYVTTASVCMYVFKYFDTLKKKYEVMLKDLRDLLLMKY